MLHLPHREPFGEVDCGRAACELPALQLTAKRWSAGSVLTAALMRHVMEVDQAREVDNLTGDDTYKRESMSQRRERWGLVAFDWRTPGGLWAGAKHWLGKVIKKPHQSLEKATMPA